MRMRWRIRALMLTTAAIAVLLTGARLWRQSDENASQARHHAMLEKGLLQDSQARLDSVRGHRNFFEKHRRTAHEESTAQIARQRAKLDTYRDHPGLTESLARRISRLEAELDRRQAAWDEWLEQEVRETERKIAPIQAEAESLASQAEHHAQLKRQYERAALFPWERVGPDATDDGPN